MPPLLLGAIAALCIGVSDTFGRASSTRASAISHVSTQMLVGAFASIPLLLLVKSSFLAADVLMGALSGACIGVGLATLYKAMADSSSAIAAPTGGVVAAVIPLAWDVGFGDASISGTTALGCAIAIAALGIVGYNPSMEQSTRRSGLARAILAGAALGLAVVFAGDTSAESGVWPAATQRLVGFFAMAPLALRSKVPVLLPTSVRRFGVLGGIFGAFGMAAWVVGSQQGDLGTVSVVAATYPAVVVLLSNLFDDDEIRWWQALGVAGAIAGSALIALG